jgi:hypothetical protein
MCINVNIHINAYALHRALSTMLTNERTTQSLSAYVVVSPLTAPSSHAHTYVIQQFLLPAQQCCVLAFWDCAQRWSTTSLLRCVRACSLCVRVCVCMGLFALLYRHNHWPLTACTLHRHRLSSVSRLCRPIQVERVRPSDTLFESLLAATC